MGIFSRSEVVIIKESSDAKEYLEKLQILLAKASGDNKAKIEKEIAIVTAGIIGEENILFELKNSGMDLVVLHDLYINTQSGLSAQIDFLVIAPKCIYIIECKNLFGNIEINNSGDFIRTINYGKKYYKEGIYSPITQNERHMSVLKEIRGENKGFFARAFRNAVFDDFFKGVVVLANPKTVVNDKYAKKEVKNKVIRADQLIKYIKDTEAQSKELSSSLKDMMSIGQNYLDMNVKERPEYIDRFNSLTQETEVASLESEAEESQNDSKQSAINNDKTDMICPRCGSKLVLRTAKKGDNAGNQFYGCSSFPKCRYVKNL